MKKKNNSLMFSDKEPVLPQIGPNWHDVKICEIEMCTQCTLYSSSVLIFCCLYIYVYVVHIKVGFLENSQN